MKLTKEQREEAKKELVKRLEAAIEETPRGITVGEICEALLKTSSNLGLIRMDNWPCRYCEHLKSLNKPGTKYIGGCEFGLETETCGRFELAKCYEGHDPRQHKDNNDMQLPESICTDGSIAK